MFNFVVQVNQLISSNLNSMVSAASNPVKILALFQRDLRELVVSLQSDLSRARRESERLAAQAIELEFAAADWTDKAKLAMDGKREDLARSALLTREQVLADADTARAGAKAAEAEVAELVAAIAELEAKLAETDLRLAEERARAERGGGSGSRSERVLDRVAALGKRVEFATQQAPKTASAAVDAEIEQLRRNARVSEALASMKAATKPSAKAPAKKARTR